jgi:flagellar biosynthetic protein FliR
LVAAVMLAAGGHRFIFAALLESFRKMPPGQVVVNESMLILIIEQLTSGMIAGIQVAAPVVAVLLLTNLICGLISRTMPQINVLAIGLSVNALALLVVAALTIGSVGLIFEEELGRAAERLAAIW